MGGIDESSELYSTTGGEEWVSGCGYLTGTFANDWLGIPATGRKTNIWFGLFYVLREGKISESYIQLDVLAVMRQAGYQVLPPAPGAEGGKVPAPLAKDGILLTEYDPLESRKSQCNWCRRWVGACGAMCAAAMVAICAQWNNTNTGIEI